MENGLLELHNKLQNVEKKNNIVIKSQAGLNLKRWEKEKWTEQNGKPCGSSKLKVKKCRPTKIVSKKTPITWKEINYKQKQKLINEKRKIGMGKKTKKIDIVRFSKNKVLNPITNRKIKINGPTYKKLLKLKILKK